MRNFGVDVRPEPVLAALHGFPEGHRPLFGEREVDDRLHRFEPVFPRQYQPQRGPVLLWNGLAVHAGHEKGELVSRLGDRNAFDIGPGVPEFLLPWRGLGIEKRLHLNVFRRAQRLGEIEQGRQRKPAPRHRHRPRLDAAMAIEPLFERHLLQQFVNVDGERFLDQPVDLDRPRTDLQCLSVGCDRFLRAELVEVVVRRRQLFSGQRPVECVARVLLGGIEASRRIFLRRKGRAQCRRQDRAGRNRFDHRPAPEEHYLRRRRTLAKLPASSSPDPHDRTSLPLRPGIWVGFR